MLKTFNFVYCVAKELEDREPPKCSIAGSESSGLARMEEFEWVPNSREGAHTDYGPGGKSVV